MKAQIIVEDKEYKVNYFISDSYNKPRLVYFYVNEIDLSNLRLIFKNIYKITTEENGNKVCTKVHDQMCGWLCVAVKIYAGISSG